MNRKEIYKKKEILEIFIFFNKALYKYLYIIHDDSGRVIA